MRCRNSTTSRFLRTVCTVLAAAAAWTAAAHTVHAALPPERINYQGVLRDAAGAPLDGEYDMVFRLWSAESAGDEILVDRHLAANLQPVAVTGGLFGAAIGAGDILDGAGPGTYSMLSEVFRDHGDVWLEVQIGSETLAPRTAISAAGYALNAAHLDGRSAGQFLDTSTTQQTKVGGLIVDASGIQSTGLSATGDAYGVIGFGNSIGGYFVNPFFGSSAYLASDIGIEALGAGAGGVFFDSDQTGGAYVAFGEYGIRAFGSSMGGFFEDSDNSGYAYVGYGEYGIHGYGNSAGGYFSDRNSNGYSYVGVDNHGIHAYGTTAGGYFNDTNAGTQARTAYGSSSTWGTGAKNFVQNHPRDPSRKIVYAALEGNEVGTYTRGSARLEGGRARIALDETFAWVTNPDVGLTAQVTSRSSGGVVYVESVSTEELVVRAVDGFDDDAAFDYVVTGLRIGFEQISTVQLKEDGESLPIPSMAEHRELLAKQPEFEAFTPLERFKTMESRAFPGRHAAGLDLSRSQALIAAIHEFDPATDVATHPEAPSDSAAAHPVQPRKSGSEPRSESVASSRTTVSGSPAKPIDADASRNIRSDEPGANPVGAVRLPVTGKVEDGDLLTLDPDRPGALQVATTMGDPGVVGVAAGSGVRSGDRPDDRPHEAAVYCVGVATIKADAGYGAIRPGDLLTSSNTPGHAMLAQTVEPGTIVGKALEPLDVGTGTIRVLLMAR